MGILLCEHNFRDVWIRNKSVRAEIGQILRAHTHTHTHTAKLVVRMAQNDTACQTAMLGLWCEFALHLLSVVDIAMSE